MATNTRTNRAVRGKKLRRSRPNCLSALTSLVSFDEPGEQAGLANERISGNVALGSADTGFMRLQSEPHIQIGRLPDNDSCMRKTLSQDWLKSTFSPRAGQSSEKRTYWVGVGINSLPRVTTRTSLASISEAGDEVEREDGSEISDEHGPAAEDVSQKNRDGAPARRPSEQSLAFRETNTQVPRALAGTKSLSKPVEEGKK